MKKFLITVVGENNKAIAVTEILSITKDEAAQDVCRNLLRSNDFVIIGSLIIRRDVVKYIYIN